MNTPQPITITFLSRTHEISAYDSEGLEYRQDCGNGLEIRLYRLNRGWMARLDFALPLDTYVRSGGNDTAQAAVNEIQRFLSPLAAALFPSLLGAEPLVSLERARDLLCDAEDNDIPGAAARNIQDALVSISHAELVIREPLCDEPTVEMSREMLQEALQQGTPTESEEERIAAEVHERMTGIMRVSGPDAERILAEMDKPTTPEQQRHAEECEQLYRESMAKLDLRHLADYDRVFGGQDDEPLEIDAITGEPR